MLKSIGLLAVLFAGWGIARTRPVVNLPVFALTLFVGVSAHSAVQSAIFENRLHERVGDPRAGAPDMVVVLIALGEAIGLWGAVLLIPWARFGARVWAAAYCVAAATVAGATFYLPVGDDFFFSGQTIGMDGPPYLLAAIVLLPIGAVGFLVGWLRNKNSLPDDD